MDRHQAQLPGLILRLHDFWSRQGCVILQPYDVEMGAGTFHPATTLRALGPQALARRLCAAEPPADRRPLRREPEPAAALLPVPGDHEAVSPADAQELLLGSYREIGLDPLLHDFRFVEDDWESPTLGAWGLGWEVWCDGMEVGQFTYFQQVGGIPVTLPSFEMTYGLERLAMYVQDVDNVYDLDFNGAGRDATATCSCAPSANTARINFEHADTAHADPPFRRRRGRMRGAAGAAAGAAGLRPVHQGEPSVQSAGCARRDQRDRAGELYRPRAGAGEGLLRGLGGRRDGNMEETT